MSKVKLSVWEASIIKNLERSMTAPKNRIARIQERVQRAIDKGDEEIAEINSQIEGIEAMIVKVREDAGARQETINASSEEAEAEAVPNHSENVGEEVFNDPSPSSNEDMPTGPGEGTPWDNYSGEAPNTSVSDIFNDHD